MNFLWGTSHCTQALHQNCPLKCHITDFYSTHFIFMNSQEDTKDICMALKKSLLHMMIIAICKQSIWLTCELVLTSHDIIKLQHSWHTWHIEHITHLNNQHPHQHSLLYTYVKIEKQCIVKTFTKTMTECIKSVDATQSNNIQGKPDTARTFNQTKSFITGHWSTTTSSSM